MERVMIDPDLGGHRLLCIARLLQIPLQRTQQLIRTNNTFFWQSIPPLQAVTLKYTSLETTMKRAPDDRAEEAAMPLDSFSPQAGGMHRVTSKYFNIRPRLGPSNQVKRSVGSAIEALKI